MTGTDESMGVRKRGVREGEVALNEVKGFTRTEGGGGWRLSSVPGRVGSGMINREMGGQVHGRQWGKVGTLACWTLVEPGWLGTASGVRAANMAGVKSEGRHREYGQLTWQG
jgi:hypothetical protein